MPSPHQDLLARAELFSRLSTASRARVAEVATTRVLAAGEWLFREGEPGGFVFVVAEGAVQALRHGNAGSDVLLRELVPGELGGATSITTGAPRSASVRAAKRAVVLTVNKGDFLALMHERAEFGEALAGYLSDKVRAKTLRLVEALSGPRDARPRVAFFDAKPYDHHAFASRLQPDFAVSWFDTRLGTATATLAAGHAIACVFVNDTVNAEVLEALAASGTRLVALRCAGFNQVDVAAAARLGISVVHVRAYSPAAVAEHAVALLLTLSRKTHRAYARVREGNFSLSGLEGFNLSGRTAGIVGLGRIGSALASILNGFGMRVLAHDPAAGTPTPGVEHVTLQRLFAESDVISLHAPLTSGSFHMVNAATIAGMKRGVVLINTSRGGLVDTAALVAGLKSGQVGAAGLDVYEEEAGYFFEDRSGTAISDDVLARLLTFPNVLITSHQGFLTEEALANIADTTVGSLREFVSGKRGKALSQAVPTYP